MRRRRRWKEPSWVRLKLLRDQAEETLAENSSLQPKLTYARKNLAAMEMLIFHRDDELARIKERVTEIRSSPNSGRLFLFGLVRLFNPEAKKELHALAARTKELRIPKQYRIALEPGGATVTFPSLDAMHTEMKSRLFAIEEKRRYAQQTRQAHLDEATRLSSAMQAKRVATLEVSKEKRIRRLERLSPELHPDRIRELGDVLKKHIEKNVRCPYCDGIISAGGHVDHIRAICRNGRSNRQNMIHVCEICNLRKGKKSLRVFVEEYRLDANAIRARLQGFNKDTDGL